MDLSQKCCDKCSQQRDENQKLNILNQQKQEENLKLLFDISLAKAECEKEKQLRLQLDKQLADSQSLTEQVIHRSFSSNFVFCSNRNFQFENLLKKTKKNESELVDTKTHYENLFTEQVNNVKKLVKERELLHLYIERLESENASLVTITNDHETSKLLTYASQSPTTLEVKFLVFQ